MRYLLLFLFMSRYVLAQDIFEQVSIKYNLPEGLLKAICKVESSGLPVKVVSNDGGSASYGPCQVKFTTAQFLDHFYHTKTHVSISTLHTEEINIMYAALYLHYQLVRYNDDYVEAIIAYNQGSYKEGHGYRYLTKVMSAMEGE